MGRIWRPLLVTEPVGVQRSAYFLSIPYLYAIPLQVASGVLHWLVSQSFFLAKVDVFNALPSDNIPVSTINTVGYSLYALIFVVSLGGLMLVVLVSFAACRRLRSPIQLVKGRSLAISAACHSIGDEIDTAEKEGMWGVVGRRAEEMGRDGWILEGSGVERDGTLHCSLSAKEVLSPEEWATKEEKGVDRTTRRTVELFA